MNPTPRMEIEEQQEYEDVCIFCDVIYRALSPNTPDEDINLAEARAKCASCQKIFKFDALFRSTEKNKMLFGGKRNKGRKSIISTNEMKAIKSLHSEGKSIREIAKLFGYNKNTILKILHN